MGLCQASQVSSTVVRPPLALWWNAGPVERGGSPPPYSRWEPQKRGLLWRRQRWRQSGQGTRGEGKGVGATNSGPRTGRRGGAWRDARIGSTPRRKARSGRGEGAALRCPPPVPTGDKPGRVRDRRYGTTGTAEVPPQSPGAAAVARPEAAAGRTLPQTGKRVVNPNTQSDGERGGQATQREASQD